MRATCLRYTRSKARTSPAAAAATSDASSSTASLSELLERSTDPASEIVPRGRPMCQSRWLVQPGRLHEETTRQPEDEDPLLRSGRPPAAGGSSEQPKPEAVGKQRAAASSAQPRFPVPLSA